MKDKIGVMNALYPMPVAMVGALVNGKPNFMPIAHVGILNASPPHLVSVSMGKVHYTNQGIKEQQTFSLNLPSEPLMRKVDYCGIVSGKKVDKSWVFESVFGELKTAPLIKDCPVSMECRLVNHLELPTHDVFIGEIAATYADETVLTHGKIDIAKLKPILFDMSSRKYWSLGAAIGDCWDVEKKMER